jgi:phosphoribosylformylglycinamidine cyclo-ligase
MKSSLKQDAYAQAGVNIDAGNEAVRRMKRHVAQTRTPGVLTDIGLFGGLFALPGNYRRPVLVASTDGVGTKIMIAAQMKLYDTVGQDLVNHCVNDILVQGARPLFFLDYFATGKLKPAVAEQIVKGLSVACKRNGCALLGGETAEMPGLYQGEDFDLAGTIVGIVERDQVVDGSTILPGDKVLGLPSSGLHTNGYSLARHLFFKIMKLGVVSRYPGLPGTVGRALLKPHISYWPQIGPLLSKKRIKGMAHITGGGFIENIPRILPGSCAVEINLGSWPVSPLFQILVREGKLDLVTQYRTFNMGIGMVIIASPGDARFIQKALQAKKYPVYEIGQVIQGEKQVLLK